MPLYPWLLALNDPDKPAGEVRGLGLVNWRDCIGEGGASKGGQRAFMILKEIIVLCYFREVRRRRRLVAEDLRRGRRLVAEAEDLRGFLYCLPPYFSDTGNDSGNVSGNESLTPNSIL